MLIQHQSATLELNQLRVYRRLGQELEERLVTQFSRQRGRCAPVQAISSEEIISGFRSRRLGSTVQISITAGTMAPLPNHHLSGEEGLAFPMMPSGDAGDIEQQHEGSNNSSLVLTSSTGGHDEGAEGNARTRHMKWSVNETDRLLNAALGRRKTRADLVVPVNRHLGRTYPKKCKEGLGRSVKGGWIRSQNPTQQSRNSVVATTRSLGRSPRWNSEALNFPLPYRKIGTIRFARLKRNRCVDQTWKCGSNTGQQP